MNLEPSEEQRLIVRTVRDFVEREIYPHEAAVERTGSVPPDLAERIRARTLELGFYACHFPESVGGAGLGHLDFALVERELGRGSMALAHFFGRPQNILMACEGEQIERYLLPAVRGGEDGRARHDRARCGLRRPLDGVHDATGRRRLGDRRHQALHLRSRARRLRHRVRRHRRRRHAARTEEAHHHLPRRSGRPRLLGPGRLHLRQPPRLRQLACTSSGSTISRPLPGVTGYLAEEMVDAGVAEPLIGLRRDRCYGA